MPPSLHNAVAGSRNESRPAFLWFKCGTLLSGRWPRRVGGSERQCAAEALERGPPGPRSMLYLSPRPTKTNGTTPELLYCTDPSVSQRSTTPILFITT